VVATEEAIVPAEDAAPAAPPPAAEVAAGPSRWQRTVGWLEEAYTRPGSRPFQTVLDLTVFFVMLSLLLMILEGIPAVDERFHDVLFAGEAVVVALFGFDYVANIVFRQDKLGYVLGIWGIIDFLAIVPFFLSLGNFAGLRAGRTLRALRTLRTLRVLKLARLAPSDDSAPEEARHSVWRDFEFAFIAACSILVIAEMVLEWDSDRVFWLAFGVLAAGNVAARRWCMRHERNALSALLVFAALVTEVSAAMNLDSAGSSGESGLVALIPVVFTIGTTLAVEVPTGRSEPAD